MEDTQPAQTVIAIDALSDDRQDETGDQESLQNGAETQMPNSTDLNNLHITLPTDLNNLHVTLPTNSFHDFIIQASITLQQHQELGEKNPQLSETTTELKSKAKAKSKPKNSKQQQFPPYITQKEAEDGLKTGDLIKGIIRINPKNNRRAYVSNADPLQEDYLLEPAEDRNRALEGDIVVIKLKPKSEWLKNKKKAIVVYIMERVHTRITVGTLHAFADNNNQFGMLIPLDYRIPKIRVSATDCPHGFREHPKKFRKFLYKAKISTWNDIRYAVGKILEEIGKAGDLEAETTALIIESDLDVTPVSNELLDLPLLDTIPPLELQNREDFRKLCVFTIDPDTAHDLDDAVSCEKLYNGNFEIGVHISDVTYYLGEGTPVDKCACKKAATTYLANKAFHMLPQQLCTHCSLVPGADKLTFSVIWEMTRTGKIVSHRFVRAVINSCVQLSYEHAQTMIEKPNYVFKEGEFPSIFGGFTYRELTRAINYLHKIALHLRADRFIKGALRIDQTKVTFRLDEKTGEPIGYTAYEYKEAHKLIEEFMLLANISVAHKIAEAFPNMAFLRCHSPPNKRLLLHWQKTLSLYGIDIDIESSKELQSSIWNIKTQNIFGPEQKVALKHLIIKPMLRARYVCAANIDNEDDFCHYALHVPMYTHFTSPIRRYADIVVHRLLSASLGYTKKHIWKLKYLTTVANNCNKKKDSAKCAEKYSRDLYLAHYIECHQPFIRKAVVIDVKKNSFDVLVVEIGSVIRIYPKQAFGEDVKYDQVTTGNKMHKLFKLELPKTSELPQHCCMIHLFAVLKVSLFRKFKTRRLEAKLVRKGAT